MMAPGVVSLIRKEFGDAALDSRPDLVDAIMVWKHRGTLGDLTRFANLADVSIRVGSEVPMAEISRIQGLRGLSLWDCDVVDVSPLAECKALTMVEFNRCLVRDIEPLVALPKLRWFSITGCPLTDESFEEHLPAIWGRGVRKALLFPPEAWRITRKLNDRGAACSCWVDDYGDLRIFAPGIDGDTLGSPGLTEAQVDEVLSGVSGDLDAATFIQLARDYNRRLKESGG